MKNTFELILISTSLLSVIPVQTISVCNERANHYSPRTRPSMCLPCRVCGEGEFIKRHCTNDSDTECEVCPFGRFAHKPNSLKCSRCPDGTYFHDGMCRNCSACKPGQYASRPCSPSKDTVCKDCLLGSYTERENVAEVCQPCRQCKRNRVYLKICDTKQDSECGGCKEGYYLHENTRECRKCSYCYPQSPGYTIKVNACLKTNLPDYSCMEVIAPPPLVPSSVLSTIVPVSEFPVDVDGGSDKLISKKLIIMFVSAVILCFLTWLIFQMRRSRTKTSCDKSSDCDNSMKELILKGSNLTTV